MAEAYGNDVEFLSDQLERLEAMVERRLALRGDKSAPEFTFGDERHIRVEATPWHDRLSAAERRIADRLAATRQAGRGIALETLARDYQLEAFECDLLLLALAPALDLRFAELYDRVAYKYRGRTVDTALTILCDGLADKVAARRYFMLESTLLRHHLLLVERDRFHNEDDVLGLELKLPRRVMNLLLGSGGFDESLASFSKLVEPTVDIEQVVLASDVKERVVRMVEHHGEFLKRRAQWGFERIIGYGNGMVMLFAGMPGTGKTMLANALAKRLGKRLLLVSFDRLYDRVHTLESNLDNVFREAKLQGSVLFFDECERLFADRRLGNAGVAELLTFLERFDGIAILATNLAPVLDEAMDRRILLRVDFELPTPELREAIWRNHLPPEAPLAKDIDVRSLAERFEFTGGYIKNAVLSALHEVLARKDQVPVIGHADLLAACRSQLRSKLGAYTDRIVPQVGLDAVILPAPLRAQLFELVDVVRHRATVFLEWGLGARLSMGKGIAVLFQGEPGTGKSMAAEALAFELGKNLYRISLPAVVSKFVGETEKNIAAAFAAARESDSVLLFDEADALFSRRTSVGGALERYANMEVNLLLQELEKFEGLAILATNRATSMDSAFERRLAYRLVFPFPDGAAREEIWRGLMLPKIPQTYLDFNRLGRRFELSGGHIKNAVLKAAYRAAREINERRFVTQAMLEQAAEEETLALLDPKTRFGFGMEAAGQEDRPA